MINEENLREKDTVNQIKDEIKLDEYEETTDGAKADSSENAAVEGETAAEEKSTENESAKEKDSEKQPEHSKA